MNHAAETGRRLRAVLLPPNRWLPERAAWQPGSGPDPFALDRHLAGCGIDTVVLDPGSRPFNPFAGRHPLLQGLDPLRALRVLLRERHADIVVSVFESAALPLGLVRRLAAFRVPVVVWDPGLTEIWRLRERILDRVVPRAEGVFVLGGNQRDYIVGRWGRADGVAVIGHSVDTDFFAPLPETADGPVLSVGEDLGRDFACLLDIAPQLDCDIVIKTRRIPATQPLPPRVTVRREHLAYPELRALYARSRFVVVPLTETLNASGVSTILEAAAMGRAVIVSDTAAMRDFIIPGETCLIVPVGDRAALAAAVRRLLAEPDTCARLGAAGRRFVQTRCAVPVFAARFADLLRRYARLG